jgi:ABC-type histidine transport system ATPase subunit
VGSLGGGWQRRVDIAAALVHGPRPLVLHGPTAAWTLPALQTRVTRSRGAFPLTARGRPFDAAGMVVWSP